MAHGMTNFTPEVVNNAEDPYKAFSLYIQQRLGVPPTAKWDEAMLRKKCKEFFNEYPHTDWFTLCRVVVWMATHKKRVAHVSAVMEHVRKAWEKGQLPELDPVNRDDGKADDMISKALEREDDPRWRRRLILARTAKDKREVYALWEKSLEMVN